MGSKGSKPRKPSHSQHLPKVGTPQENERLQHAEREAVLENFGVHAGAGKWIMGTVIVVLVLGAIGGLILLVALR